MKQLIKNNLVLIAGIALPLALMLLFQIAQMATRASVADPQYDLIFTADGYLDPAWKVSIKNEQLAVDYAPAKDQTGVIVPPAPQIYQLDHRTMTASLLNIDYSHPANGKVQDPAIETINKSRLSAAKLSPDGYQLLSQYDSGRGLFTEMFGVGRNRGGYVLRKDKRSVAVKTGGDLTYLNANFVGWLVGPKP